MSPEDADQLALLCLLMEKHYAVEYITGRQYFAGFVALPAMPLFYHG